MYVTAQRAAEDEIEAWKKALGTQRYKLLPPKAAIEPTIVPLTEPQRQALFVARRRRQKGGARAEGRHADTEGLDRLVIMFDLVDRLASVKVATLARSSPQADKNELKGFIK